MTRFTLFAIVVGVLAAGPVTGAPPARTLYADAHAHENTVRTELESDARTLDTLRTARSVVAEYEVLVKLYPTSGYSDNALWQAGTLSLEAFNRFGQAQDRSKAVLLFRTLASTYPTSSLVAQVPEQLSKAGETSARPIATIQNIHRAVLPDTVRITIELDSEVAFHQERIADPDRVFLDLTAARAAPALVDRTIRFDSDADIVRQVRLGRHPNNTTRVVLDAAGVASYSVYPVYNPYRLVIDCARAPQPKPAPPAPVLLPARRLNNDWGRRLPSRPPMQSPAIDEARAVLTALAYPPPSPQPQPASAAPIAQAPPAIAAAAAVNPPVKPLTGGVSMARQLGLNVSRIVIDPGHGGHDPGAQGKGINESDLVLDVALRLETLLSAVPGVDVILTRRTDEFVGLQERTAIANREGADLFLSIHANAAANVAARGIETYFLNFASNLGAARVAARENAASGQAMAALPDYVKAIALNNKIDESRDFAAHVQQALIEKLRSQSLNRTLPDLGVKQAPFVVLIGAAMPSVLTEISFLSNTQDLKLLKGDDYRQKIAEALYGGVRKYQLSLQNAQSIASR